MDGPLLTVKDVCALLQLSDRTVYLLTANGRLPAVRIGGSLRYEREQLERYIESQRRNTQPVSVTA